VDKEYSNPQPFTRKRVLTKRPDNAAGLPEIYGFCDGGDNEYGSVIFLRWKLTDGRYSFVPLTGTAFVAPLKKRSIPRLELTGMSYALQVV